MQHKVNHTVNTRRDVGLRCSTAPLRLLLLGASLWWSLIPLPLAGLELNELIYVTESSASFNYVADGKLQGPAVELLLAATQRAGSPVRRDAIRVLPWARGFRTAKRGPRRVLFSTLRTPERDAHFQWVGPIGYESDVLIGLKARQFSVETPAQLQGFTIGAVKDDVGQEILRSVGIKPSHIVVTSHVDSLGRMLNAGRIDLWAFGEGGWRYTLLKSDIDPAQFEVVYRFAPREYYFAVSLDVSAQLVQQLQTAVDAILKEQGPLPLDVHTP